MGLAGYLAMRAAGNAYGGGPPYFLSGDDDESIRDIKRGARHGRKDRLNPLKRIWR